MIQPKKKTLRSYGIDVLVMGGIAFVVYLMVNTAMQPPAHEYRFIDCSEVNYRKDLS